MKKVIKKTFKRLGYQIAKAPRVSDYAIIYNRFKNYTMIPEHIYCENLKIIDNYVRNLNGDVVECGVWRGGMIAGIAALLGDARIYHLYDSFEGLPEAKEIDGLDALQWQKNKDGEQYFDNCKAEIEYAYSAMSETKTMFHLNKGWFKETLPLFNAHNRIAILRLDGDWYESTRDCLKYLYPKVNYGGIIIIDDYYTWEGCSRAVHEYLYSIGSISKIFTSHNGLCYIIKKDQYE